MSNLRKTMSTRISTDERKNEMPPKGATIIEQNISTSTEEIENGFLVTKSVDGRYTLKSNKKDSDGEYDDSRYFSYTKKWYSKTDPLTINIDNKSLADSFEE